MKKICFIAILMPFLNLTAQISSDNILYQNNSYTLYRDSLVELGDKAVAKQRGAWMSLYNARGELVRPFLKGDYPTLETSSNMLNMLYRIALYDMEINIVDNKHFRVSPDFHYNMFFTRDIAFSSMLGANYAFPQMVKSHIKECRKLRRMVGLKAAKGHEIPIATIGQHQIVENLTSSGFFEKYSTHSYARRTDDICWVSGYWAAMQAKTNESELYWLLEEFNYFDENFYTHFLDKDGLYRGQAAFIDVGSSGYPENFTIQQSVMIKALSTNCLYYQAFRILEECCKKLNKEKEQKAFNQRADKIKEAILKEFYHPDGYYVYFIHENGVQETKREQLGMAFMVLFGILTPNEYHKAIGNYPANDFGNPLFFPFYNNNKIYHNNSIWPFANTFYNWAEFTEQKNDEVLLRTLANLSRHALQGNFNEVYDYETGGRTEMHARQYTWSAASFMAIVYNFLLGIKIIDFEKISFTPHIPLVLGDTVKLNNLKIQNSIINLTIKGTGQITEQIIVNGVKYPNGDISLINGSMNIVIELR